MLADFLMLTVYSGLQSWNQRLSRCPNRAISAAYVIAGTFYFELSPNLQVIYFPRTGAGTMHNCTSSLAAREGFEARAGTGATRAGLFSGFSQEPKPEPPRKVLFCAGADLQPWSRSRSRGHPKNFSPATLGLMQCRILNIF